jgi:hypothetical protein
MLMMRADIGQRAGWGFGAGNGGVTLIMEPVEIQIAFEPTNPKNDNDGRKRVLAV